MENPADHPEPFDWTLKKTQIWLDAEEETRETLVAHGDGTRYRRHKRVSVEISELMEAEAE